MKNANFYFIGIALCALAMCSCTKSNASETEKVQSSSTITLPPEWSPTTTHARLSTSTHLPLPTTQPSLAATALSRYRMTASAQASIIPSSTQTPTSEIPKWLTPVAAYSQSNDLLSDEDKLIDFRLLRAYLGWDFDGAYFAPVDSRMYKIWFESVRLPENWFTPDGYVNTGNKYRVFWAFPPTPTPPPSTTVTPMGSAWWLDDNLMIQDLDLRRNILDST